MNRRLRILHLEDEPDFAELVRTMFVQDNLEATIIQIGDKPAYLEALAKEKFDLILSDYHLPSFTGLDALALARKQCPETPFILVSGTIGETAAINSLKAGATDYLLKHNPERLPAAVRRAVEEAAERARLRETEAELARREKYFRTLTENALDVLSIVNREGFFTYVSPSIENTLGLKPNELIGQNSFARVHPDDLPRVMEAFQNLLDFPDRSVRIECRQQHKNGAWLRLELSARNKFDDRDIAGIVAYTRDVTDRWRAEEELRYSEQQYRVLFQENPNPMWVFDMETLAIMEVNEAAVQHYGYPRDEFLKLTMTNLRAPDKNGHGKINGRKTDFHTRNSHGHIWRHRRKRGDVIEVDVTWSPMAFQGRFSALAMATDVTERRRGEHRDSVFLDLSHRLSTATTAAEAAHFIGDAATALFEWDSFSLDLYSQERSEIVSLLHITTADGRRVQDPPAARSGNFEALARRVISNGPELISGSDQPGEFAGGMIAPVRRGAQIIGLLFVQSRRSGAYCRRDLETLEMLANECGGALERVRVEDALHESQRRFRDLFENSPDAIFVEDLNGKVLDVNLAASLLHGVPRDQLIGKNAIEHLVPENRREEARHEFEKLASGRKTRVEGESIAGGRVTPVEIRANLIEYEGKPALLLHVRDVTERRATQTALQSSETLFRSVWENSADGMRLTDENGTIVAVNEAFCNLVGLRQEELEGKMFTVIYGASENAEEMIQQYRTNYSTREFSDNHEFHYTLHNGREVVLEVNHSFIELHGQPQLTLSLFRDITAQRRLEEQFRQSQKMEAIGQLAGGVAHDFNNILTVIQGHASLLAAAKLNPMEEKSANQISQAAARAAGLTRQLLTFSRRQLIQPKKLDMNKIVGNMTNMLGRLLGEDITLQLNYCQAAPTVEADAGMMEQVLLNLAVNARDAMPKGGQLAIRITVIEVDDSYVARQPDARKGTFVCIGVTDTGTGIAPENLPRIFEPFFTTKAIGKGTGLGLATVYGIVKQHQGWIELDSCIGKGTTFRIFLPWISSDKVGCEKPTTAITVRGGEEGVLLVEDERPVRELVARVLERYGYKIFQADNGSEAMEVWEQHKNEIQLVLTDLVMPNNMNGRELAEKLWAQSPGLKVIFTSGYSADIVGKDFKLEAELNYLQKPYQPQTLALTIRRCLDGKSK
ncbi:MAG TPA: PAS domain S-box protein [Alphaproteobacteria bacterium]|nr:PAS domain S-box protein [Alphaproteobacteria bacterium]